MSRLVAFIRSTRLFARADRSSTAPPGSRHSGTWGAISPRRWIGELEAHAVRSNWINQRTSEEYQDEKLLIHSISVSVYCPQSGTCILV